MNKSHFRSAACSDRRERAGRPGAGGKATRVSTVGCLGGLVRGRRRSRSRSNGAGMDARRVLHAATNFRRLAYSWIAHCGPVPARE